MVPAFRYLGNQIYAIKFIVFCKQALPLQTPVIYWFSDSYIRCHHNFNLNLLKITVIFLLVDLLIIFFGVFYVMDNLLRVTIGDISVTICPKVKRKKL